MWIARSRRSDNGNVAQDRAMARRIASDKKASSPHLFRSLVFRAVPLFRSCLSPLSVNAWNRIRFDITIATENLFCLKHY